MLEIDTPETFDLLIESTTQGPPLIVDCGAPWCDPCKKAAPIYERLSRKFKGTFVKLNIDDEDLSEMALEFGMTKIPYFMIFKDGTQVNDGLQNSGESQIEEFFSKHLDQEEDAGKIIEEKVQRIFNEGEALEVLQNALKQACSEIQSMFDMKFDER